MYDIIMKKLKESCKHSCKNLYWATSWDLFVCFLPPSLHFYTKCARWRRRPVWMKRDKKTHRKWMRAILYLKSNFFNVLNRITLKFHIKFCRLFAINFQFSTSILFTCNLSCARRRDEFIFDILIWHLMSNTCVMLI